MGSYLCLHRGLGAPSHRDLAGEQVLSAIPPKCPGPPGEEAVGRASRNKSELTHADHQLPKSRTWQIFWARINLPVPIVNTIILFPVWFTECNCHAHDLYKNFLPGYVNEWGVSLLLSRRSECFPRCGPPPLAAALSRLQLPCLPQTECLGQLPRRGGPAASGKRRHGHGLRSVQATLDFSSSSDSLFHS